MLSYLLKLKEDKKDINLQYKIVKNLTNQTVLYLYEDSEQFELDSETLSKHKINLSDFEIRYISKEEYDEDKEYYNDFFGEKNVFEGVTRRLGNAFGAYPLPKKKDNIPPILSFYSYKGGMGRTTTLGALASYFARKENARVFILDCDFEAPGLVNLFGLTEEQCAQKQGVIEYLIDTQNLNEAEQKQVKLDDYTITIATTAAGDTSGYAGEKGTIYVMNAGNLSTNSINEDISDEDTNSEGTSYIPNLDSHLDHYLQGLARVGFENTEAITNQFLRLIDNITAKYEPDLILFDSRTGFNDVFNNIALRISDVIVGLFGVSKQHKPGLYEFLDTTFQLNKEVFMLNSIAPEVDESHEVFLKNLDEYKRNSGNDFVFRAWSLEYIPRMQKIGTPMDKRGDILLHYTDPDNYRFPDYQHNGGGQFLNALTERINELRKKKVVIDKIPTPENSNQDIIEPVSRKDILDILSEHYPKVETHAENIADIDIKYFYFRNYMRDIFHKNIFMITGYKGTGKTLLYESLRNQEFIAKLKAFSNIDATRDIRFINMVEKNNILSFNDLGFNIDDPQKNRRFWLVFIWNKLMQTFKEYYTTPLDTFNIAATETTINIFKEYTQQKENVLQMEEDLRKLNAILQEKKIEVIIAFDYLDKIISESNWGKADNPIAKLVTWVQQNPYTNIETKLFFRTDLCKKIGSINNIIALNSNTISLDWTTNEIFGYFFQTVYNITDNKFINWLYLYHTPNSENIEKITAIKKQLAQSKGRLGENDKDEIAFLVDCFFGKYVDNNNPNFGKSYNWFYENLKSANDLISLRPFIFLMQKALNDAVENYEQDRFKEKTILSGDYYASNAAREYAGKMHYEDVTKSLAESDLLQNFAETIRNKNPMLDGFRQMSLTEAQLRRLILNIYELQGKSYIRSDEWRALVKLLEDTGIISQNLEKGNSYSFAFLYKFYLQLEGNPQRRNT